MKHSCRNYYKTCVKCGANLDPGETCDCDIKVTCDRNKIEMLLRKLYYVTHKLSSDYLYAVETGGTSRFNEEEYKKMSNVICEVEEFLGIE